MVQAIIAWLVLRFSQDGINKKALKIIRKASKLGLAANVLSSSPSIDAAATLTASKCRQ
jgi:hypothetical protein